MAPAIRKAEPRRITTAIGLNRRFPHSIGLLHKIYLTDII